MMRIGRVGLLPNIWSKLKDNKIGRGTADSILEVKILLNFVRVWSHPEFTILCTFGLDPILDQEFFKNVIEKQKLMINLEASHCFFQ